MKHHPTITDSFQTTILMGVYNGAAFLPDQLDSIAAQTHRHWHLICSDDNSTDNSGALLRAFAQRHQGKVTLLSGPQNGFSDNYMSLIRGLPDASQYVCLADQDDVWAPDKLTRALNVLEQNGTGPRLYCGRRFNWYPQPRQSLASPQLRRAFSLRNALIENVASGNTIMLNPSAAALARRAAHRTGTVFAHDWWLYLLMTATGSDVLFDNGVPKILYRQHGANIIGAGSGVSGQIRRKISVLHGTFARRVASNLSALECIDDLLTPEARDTCTQFATARQATGLKRINALRRVSPYRQRRRDTIGFWGAASLGCI